MEPKKDQLSTFEPKKTHMQIKERLKKKKKTYYLWIKNFWEAKPNGVQNYIKVT